MVQHNLKCRMLSLQSHHIINLYVLVDELLPEIPKPKGGRPSILSNSEIITILLWNILIVKQKTLKDLHNWVRLYHRSEFPRLPKYSAFVDHCHRATPLMLYLLEQVLAKQEGLRFVDSTMLPVCKLRRADTHKVAKAVAAFGKNYQGWHYGLKLHASIDRGGRLCQLAITPANIHDAQALPKIINKYTDIAVGDGAYRARVMQGKVFKYYGTLIVSPPHPKQRKQLITWWQHLLLASRSKIESVFDYLKEPLGLITSFPRSIKGYLFHYLRIVLGYQLMVL